MFEILWIVMSIFCICCEATWIWTNCFFTTTNKQYICTIWRLPDMFLVSCTNHRQIHDVSIQQSLLSPHKMEGLVQQLHSPLPPIWPLFNCWNELTWLWYLFRQLIFLIAWITGALAADGSGMDNLWRQWHWNPNTHTQTHSYPCVCVLTSLELPQQVKPAQQSQGPREGRDHILRPLIVCVFLCVWVYGVCEHG